MGEQRWKEFVREYVKTGNQTQAYMKVYKCKSDDVARAASSRALAKVNVRAYYDELIGRVEDKDIADAQEVLKYFTKVMRGEEKDQFGLDAALTDRNDAAKQLAKSYGMDKVKLVGGDEGDNPIKTESMVQIYLPDNGR